MCLLKRFCLTSEGHYLNFLDSYTKIKKCKKDLSDQNVLNWMVFKPEWRLLKHHRRIHAAPFRRVTFPSFPESILVSHPPAVSSADCLCPRWSSARRPFWRDSSLTPSWRDRTLAASRTSLQRAPRQQERKRQQLLQSSPQKSQQSRTRHFGKQQLVIFHDNYY